ncbi:MAG: peptidylprolyl isomerase [bacterium]
MAIIGKIRGYSGLLIAIIGLGLAAFVLQDFFGSSGSSAQRGTNDVGQVGDNVISYTEFENQYQENVDMFKRQRGVDNIEPNEAFMLRQQTWDRIINDYILNEEIERLGITVSARELKDMFFGTDPHPLILSAFSPDPTSGQVDKAEMINILQSLDPYDPRLVRLEEEAKKQKKKEKYISMISKAYYVPEFFANIDYKMKNANADIRYVLKRYRTLPDSTVDISDEEMHNAYEEIKHLHKQDEMRDLEYVVFPVFPSEQDREKVYQDVLELKDEFENVDARNIESFVNSVSDKRFDSTFKSRSEINPEIDSIMFNAEEGTVYGPYLNNNEFVLSKLVAVEFRPDSMSAEHVLISFQDAMQANEEVSRSYEEAKETADSLLRVAKSRPASFPELATQMSDDPSASMNNGDLGWFKDGQMVPSFNKAVIDNPVGSIVVAESQFGFHVIKITGKSKPEKKVQIADITREIVPSSTTYSKAHSDASKFALEVRDKGNFSEVAKENDLAVRQAEKLGKMSNNIPGIENAREIVRWAFSDNVEKGSLSRIFDIEDKFVIANITKIREEGFAEMTEIEEQVTKKAMLQKKYEIISEQVLNYKEESLEVLAEKLELDVIDLFDIKMASPSITGVGKEPFVVGNAFSLDENTISEPLKGIAGVFVVELVRKEMDIEPSDFTTIQEKLMQDFNNRVERSMIEALKSNEKIEDNRELFY